MKPMRTFYITLALVVCWVAWQLHKPIPKQAQYAREFTDSEIEYLERSFDYAMDNLKSGEQFDWSTAGVNGRIAVGDEYQSKQKATCRNYIEIARTYDSQKIDSGIACKRDDEDGWCRLHIGNAESCALEVAESPYAKRMRYAILQGNQILDEVMATRVHVDTSKLIPKAPHITVPSIGPIDVPHPDLGDISLRPPLPWDKK